MFGRGNIFSQSRHIWRRCRKSTVLTIRRLSEHSKSPEKAPESWRENPNLKYWVIGVSALSGIIYRYVYKEKEKQRLVVKNLPPLPNHKLYPRHMEIEELSRLHDRLKGNHAAHIHLEGSPGAGKSQLARAFAEKLATEEESRYYILPRNLLIGTINGCSFDSMLFDFKKFAIAIGCQSSDWVDKVPEGQHFINLTSDEQLSAIVEAVKAKLCANLNWVLIVEDVQDRSLFDKLFINGDGSDWGKGTVIATQDGCGESGRSLAKDVYHLDKGFPKPEAMNLLQELSGLPAEKVAGVDKLAERLCHSPLALAFAGSCINSKAKNNPDYSIEKFCNELDKAVSAIEDSKGDEKENIPYIVTALLTKELVRNSPHLLHICDLVGTCSQNWPIPVALVSLHLRIPEFGLPELPRSGPVIPVKQPEQTAQDGDPKPEEEVDEMFFSIKRLAQNLESFTTAVKDNYKAIKEMLNPPPLDLAPQGDGVLDMMKACPLVTVNRIDPGGTQTVQVNPVVHTVMSQIFHSVTMTLMEDLYLAQAEDKHNNSSFFRRLWAFDPQRILQEYRNQLGDAEGTCYHVSSLLRNNSGLDVSSLFKKYHPEGKPPDYRQIEASVSACHCQCHTSRVLETISRTASVCSQDLQTRTLARLLKPHLDHILAENTGKGLGNASRAHALTAVASIDSATGSLKSSIAPLERALQLEEQQFGESSLEVAATLTRLADVYSSLDEAQKARELLERAYSIYDLQRKKSGEYKKPLEFARTVEALGAVYGTLGFKQQSKDYIERAFSYLQSATPTTPDEIEGRRFSCEVASTLTDLGHAYLSVGDAFQSRKLLDLAVTGLKNMYGEEHPEVVRAMTVLSTAYTMQGNWQEGKKIRREAGKIQAKLDTMVPL